MSSLRYTDALAFLKQQQDAASAELRNLAKRRLAHEQTTAACAAEREQAWGALAEILLPSPEAATLEAVARRLRLPAVSSQAATSLYRQREAELEATRRSLESDPRLPQIPGLVNACDIRLAEVKEALFPLTVGLDGFDRDADFAELLAVGYGTDAYATPWWRASYYRHWKNADACVERWQPTLGADSFPTLRALYGKQRQAADTLATSRAELERERAALVELGARHAETVQALASLGPWWLEALRGRIGAHLRALPESERFSLLEGTDEVSQTAVLAAKKASALEAKVRYLDEAREHWIERPTQELRRVSEKLASAEAKVARKRERFSSDAGSFTSKYSLRTDRWHERWQRYDESCHAIVTFHRYDVYDPYADLLWWDLMAEQRLRGSFLAEVEARERWRAEQGAAAELLGDRRDGDLNLILADAS